MSSPSFRPKVFVSYSHRDRELKEKFDDNLRVLKVQGYIDFWTDGEILPGDRWSDEITEAMSEANVILFLVSNAFITSTFIREKEAPMAIEREKKGEAIIVPILLHDTPGWTKEAWSRFQVLPSKVIPVDHPDWRTPENAFADVERSLRTLIENLSAELKTPPAGGDITGGQTDGGQGAGGQGIRPVPSRKHLSAIIAVSIFALAVIVVGWYLNQPDSATDVTTPPIRPQVESGRVTPPPVLPPELSAWLDSGQIVDLGLTVSAAKENGAYQSGLQSLATNDVVVTARRTPTLLWEANGKPQKAENGITWDLAFEGGVSGAESRTFVYSVYISAVEIGSMTESPEAIRIDPRDTFAAKPLSEPGAVPRGFTHLIESTFDSANLPTVFGYKTLTTSIFAGEKGQIPEGIHWALIELRSDGVSAYRNLFLLSVPPLVFNQSRDEWQSAKPSKVDNVALVENSVIWTSENEIEFSIRIDGDPEKLREPVCFQAYVAASDAYNAGDKPWTVDPHRNQSFVPAHDIEGLDYCAFNWAIGRMDSENRERLGKLDWDEHSAIQKISLNAGPRGRFASGKHEIALQLSEYGLSAWRGFLTLVVPEKAWAFADEDNLIELTTTDGQDIRGLTLAAHRAQPHPAGLPVGMGFGPLKYKSKTSPLAGEFLIQYYLRAARAPQPPSSLASISAGPYDGIALFDRPDEGGFTARAAGTYPIENVGDTGEGILQNLAFFVGADATHPGEILPGIHSIGIEILHRETPTSEYRPVYRGITTLWLPQ